jgi:hypothetical protein
MVFKERDENADESLHVFPKTRHFLPKTRAFLLKARRCFRKLPNLAAGGWLLFLQIIHASCGIRLALQNEVDDAVDFVRVHTRILLASPRKGWR